MKIAVASEAKDMHDEPKAKEAKLDSDRNSHSETDEAQLLSDFRKYRVEFVAWRDDKLATEAAEAQTRAQVAAFENNPEWPAARVAKAVQLMRAGKENEVQLVRNVEGGQAYLLQYHLKYNECSCWVTRDPDYPGSPCACRYTSPIHSPSYRGYPSYSPTSPSYSPKSPHQGGGGGASYSPTSPSYSYVPTSPSYRPVSPRAYYSPTTPTAQPAAAASASHPQ
jgi:hypothetical protein